MIYAVSGGILLLGLAVGRFVTRVPDDDMAPSLLRGDWIVVLPMAPTRGDVVAVLDPLDPSRWTLRRVETIGGSITYDGGAYVVNGDPEPVLDMGRDEVSLTLQEGPHLTQHLTRAVRWEMGDTPVPETSVFLGADARDTAVDSRWWGSMPVALLQGVVAVRVGVPTHRWRGWVSTTP